MKEIIRDFYGLELCKEQSWWPAFLRENVITYVEYTLPPKIIVAQVIKVFEILIDPDTFADAIAKHRGWGGE